MTNEAGALLKPAKVNRDSENSEDSTLLVALKSFVSIANKDRSMMHVVEQAQPVIPVGWAPSPSIEWDG